MFGAVNKMEGCFPMNLLMKSNGNSKIVVWVFNNKQCFTFCLEKQIWPFDLSVDCDGLV